MRTQKQANRATRKAIRRAHSSVADLEAERMRRLVEILDINASITRYEQTIAAFEEALSTG